MKAMLVVITCRDSNFSGYWVLAYDSKVLERLMVSGSERNYQEAREIVRAHGGVQPVYQAAFCAENYSWVVIV